MDVARAADPRRAQEATRKLASYTGAPAGDFATLVARPASGASAATSFGRREPISPRATDSAPRARPKIASTGDAVTDAYRALGALLIQKMVEGRIRKYYEEVVLLEQVWVHDGESRVKAVVEKAGAKLSGFARFQLGEGIEKQTSDFAAEVAAAAGQG